MSFIITVYVNEGIVLASDRRTTYTNTLTENGNVTQLIGIHSTNSTDKTFVCPNGAGISCCGDGSILRKPIAGFIQDMIRNNIDEDCCIESMPEKVIDYFNNLSEVPDANFIIAGYNNGESCKQQLIYKVNVKTSQIEKTDTTKQGALWEGEITTLSRLMQNVAIKTDEGEYLDFPSENVLWEYFTLQDAVDFARYAVETTIQTMRFKNVIETVGGAVDILVITPDGTKWLQKEMLN